MYARINMDFSLKGTITDYEYGILPNDKKLNYRKVIEDMPNGYGNSSGDSPSYGSSSSNDFIFDPGPSSFDSGSSDNSSLDSGSGFDFGGGDGGGGGASGDW